MFTMIRTIQRQSAVASILAVFALAGHAPQCAWGAGPGGSVTAKASNVAPTSSADINPEDDASRLVVTADFNRDGIADTAEAIAPPKHGSAPGVLTLSLGRADGSFQQSTSRPVLDHQPRSIVAGDFNHDGIPDLLIGDYDGSLRLFLGDGRGNLAPGSEIAHLDSIVSITAADFNHDGVLDVAISDWRASSVTVLLGTGTGSFHRGPSFPLRMRGTSPEVSTADFNGDGIPDLAVVYGDDGSYTFDVMLGNGKGSFTQSPELSSVIDPNAHCPT